MTFRDIFKSSFLENMDSVPLLDMAIALVLSFLLGLFIFAIYKQCYAGSAMGWPLWTSNPLE